MKVIVSNQAGWQMNSNILHMPIPAGIGAQEPTETANFYVVSGVPGIGISFCMSDTLPLSLFSSPYY